MTYNIKALMEEYSKLRKLIKAKEKAITDKTIAFRETLDKVRYYSAENDLKKAIFAKKIKPFEQELEKLRNQRRAMEKKYCFEVCLDDLYSELAKSTKKNGNTLILNVEPIDYPWATKSRDINPTMLNNYIKSDSFSANFDITMYNKSTSFYFRKRMDLGKYLKFTDRTTLKNNTIIDYSILPFKIKFKDAGKLLVPFSLPDLFCKSDAYDIKKVQKAVVKAYEKLHPTM